MFCHKLAYFCQHDVTILPSWWIVMNFCQHYVTIFNPHHLAYMGPFVLVFSPFMIHLKKGRANVLQVTRTLPSMSHKEMSQGLLNRFTFHGVWRHDPGLSDLLADEQRLSRDDPGIPARPGIRGRSRLGDIPCIQNLSLCITASPSTMQTMHCNPPIYSQSLLIGSKFYPNHARL